MNLTKLNELLAAEPKYRYNQINQALFKDFVASWDEVSSLPKALREQLAAECPLEIQAEVIKDKNNPRGLKALITLADGQAVETVLIGQKNKITDQSETQRTFRYTVCLSSQVGCALGCAFCATGDSGFTRNLSAEEIVEQLIFWARYLQTEKAGAKIDNVVFMGMGEPFLNYDQFIKAVKFINNPETLNIGSRRLSVSTSGIVEGIKRLAGEKLQINLAISLHAAKDDLRQGLMPIAKKYSLFEILKAVDQYINKTGRRVMFEYLMLKNINDSEQDALALAKLLARPLYLVNLIPYNPTGRFEASSPERIAKFQATLEENGVPTTVRLSFGASIGAACGQLRGRRQK
jgi:23S rRNA (adenine2503-C2)-methyltransferase